MVEIQPHSLKAKPLLIVESFPPKQSNVLSLLDELGYHSIDADHLASMNPKTTNLFAWQILRTPR